MVGNVILLREPLLKPSQFPMVLVIKVCKNNIGEVTDAHAKIGCNGEVVRRHVTSIVLHLSSAENNSAKIGTVPEDDSGNATVHNAPSWLHPGPQRQCRKCYLVHSGREIVVRTVLLITCKYLVL